MIGRGTAVALRAAAERLADTMREIAGVKTSRGRAAVNVATDGDDLIVQAGHPGGPWGWTPIVPAMFEDNLRHELFGNPRYWYHQGRYPITALTILMGIDDSVETFADIAVPALLEETGF